MRRVLATAALALCACALRGRAPAGLPPLLDEGELHVYLAPFPHQARRLSFTLGALTAVAESGEAASLPLALTAVVAAEQLRGERLLASARLPPGRYQRLEVTVVRASLQGEEGTAALLVRPEPARVEAHFEIRRGRAAVLLLAFDPERSLEKDFALAPAFHATQPTPPAPGLVAACSSSRGNGVALFDARTKAVGGLIATGPSPQGVALDPVAGRAYVALAGQDQVEVLDTSRGESMDRIPMRGGDEPRALLLLPDRRTLLVVASSARAAAFVDVVSRQELARVPLGEGPWSVVAQRSGNRAFVVNRRSSSITVLDLAARQVVATVPTEPEPLFAQVGRDGGSLYVVHAGSLYLTEHALPGLAVSRRIRVGLGASALKLDARTGLLYVAHAGSPRIQVYDAPSALPVDAFDLPGAATQLAIDDLQDQLFAVMPARRAVAVVDLTSRKLVSVLEVAAEPFEIRLAAERN